MIEYSVLFVTKERVDGKKTCVLETICARDPFFLEKKIADKMKDENYIEFFFTKKKHLMDVDMLNFATHHSEDLEKFLVMKDSYEDIF